MVSKRSQCCLCFRSRTSPEAHCSPCDIRHLRPTEIRHNERNLSSRRAAKQFNGFGGEGFIFFGKQPFGSNTSVHHHRDHRSRSSRCNSSVEGKGPRVKGFLARIRSICRRRACRALSSFSVGMFCSSKERTS